MLDEFEHAQKIDADLERDFQNGKKSIDKYALILFVIFFIAMGLMIAGLAWAAWEMENSPYQDDRSQPQTLIVWVKDRSFFFTRLLVKDPYFVF
ncbi:hypothetical protein [Mucilaginibacter paludis]|uniref:Uncharacterized protein n=1 Tax=Mucilaginibacter paludis DSM 18603 TaxID=714943 RepID=H1YBW1_9SPHI|nr:hypothetical protein [Mucilaginibacter paludis]EHQ27039.1 hypothetical protein Mucpa_2931 [Mucilaginibacter paludis DSM 18603]